MTAASRPSDLIFMADIVLGQRGCGGLWAFACLFVCLSKLRGSSGWLQTSGRGHGRLWLTVLIMPRSQLSHTFCSPLVLYPPAPRPTEAGMIYSEDRGKSLRERGHLWICY